MKRGPKPKPKNEIKVLKCCRVKKKYLKQLLRRHKSFQNFIDKAVEAEMSVLLNLEDVENSPN